MGRKSIINRHVLVDNQDATTVSNIDPTECAGVDLITYDLKIDGNIIGDSYIQYCNDTRITADSEWIDLDFGEPLIFNASVEQQYKIEMKVSFRHVRVDWAVASGNGNLTLAVYGTTVGA